MNQMETLEGNLKCQLGLAGRTLAQAKDTLDDARLSGTVEDIVWAQNVVKFWEGKVDGLKLAIGEIASFSISEDGEEHDDIDETILDIFNESDDVEDDDYDYVEMQSMADQIDGVKV